MSGANGALEHEGREHEVSKPRILVLGTLDTKGEEFALLRDELVALRCEPVVIDLGIMGTPLFEGDVRREEVVARAGYTVDELRDGRRRGEAMEAAIAGGTAVVSNLIEMSRVDGVIAMGGGSGTTIGTSIMAALPFGIPKLVVTTLSRLHPWVKGTDVVVVRTLVDLVGLNPITRGHIRQAAAAIAGMAKLPRQAIRNEKSIVITCLGVTTPAVMQLREQLLEHGKEVLVLHRRTHNVPLLVEAGLVEAIVDLTPNELIETVLHPGADDPDERLRSAREAGIPIVVSAGALDMHIHFGDADLVPTELASRPRIVHSRDALLLNTSAQEQAQLGAAIGRQLSESRGPIAAVIPMGGFSMWDAEGRAFSQPEARAAFADALEAAAPEGSVMRIEENINSVECAQMICDSVLRLLS